VKILTEGKYKSLLIIKEKYQNIFYYAIKKISAKTEQYYDFSHNITQITPDCLNPQINQTYENW